MALSDEQAEIGKRIQVVRRAHGASQAFIAQWICLSRDQLKRIERGEVSIRFLPGLRFCELMDANPLWLAFGDPESPFHFYWLSYNPRWWSGYKILANITSSAAAEIANEGTFLDVLQRHRGDYEAAYRSIPDDERQRWGILRAIALNRIVNRRLTMPPELGNVGSMNLRKMSFWPELRERIQQLVKQRGMKSALARDIGVTRQAVNALLGKKYVPSGEQVLKLSKWVEIAEGQQKQSAGVSETRPARKTRRKLKDREA